MRILMISSGSDPRIFEKGSRVRERMHAYAALVSELHIIVATPPGFTKFQENNLYVYPTNSKRKIFYIKDSIRIARGIKYIDLVTSQDPFETGLAAFVIANRAKAALELQIHTDPFSPFFGEESLKNKIRLFISAFLIPRAHRIRVVGERVRRELIARGIQEEKISVIPVLSSFIPAARAPIPFRVLSVGRLAREKNFGLGLHIFTHLLQEFPEATYEIVGSGPEERSLYILARELRIADRVTFIPWTKDLGPHYARAAVLLVTSNYEGYSLVLEEAALAGVPIVSTDVGMIGFELPRDSAEIAPPKDALRLYEGVRSVFLAKETGPRMALEAYKAVRLRASEEDLIAAQKRSWEEAISEYRASPKK